jgi:hypothetical protein
LIALLACSSSVTGGGGGDVAAGGPGGALDTKPPTTIAAAQPLTVGQPGPDQDPTSSHYFVYLPTVKPLCKAAGADLTQVQFSGFVRLGAYKQEVPEIFVENISLGSIRIVDKVGGRYTDLPLTSKMAFNEDNEKTYAIGYFEFNLWTHDAYHMQYFMILPKSTVQVSTPWTNCPDKEHCAPEPALQVTTNTVSGDVEGKVIVEEPLGICQVAGGSANITPQLLWGGDDEN